MKTKEITVEIPYGYYFENFDYNYNDGCLEKAFIRLEKKPIKVGDIVIYEDDCYRNIAIVGEIDGDGFQAIITTTPVDCDDDSEFIAYDTDSYRHANKAERAEMMKYLDDNNLKWDKEKNTIEKIRWRAECNTYYKFVNFLGFVDCRIESFNYTDDKLYSIGNYFSTSKEAKASKFYKVFHEKE